MPICDFARGGGHGCVSGGGGKEGGGFKVVGQWRRYVIFTGGGHGGRGQNGQGKSGGREGGGFDRVGR